jgi:hypothetical protein
LIKPQQASWIYSDAPGDHAFKSSFRDAVEARAARDPAFREAMFQEAMRALLQGDVDSGRSALRVYINATIGFEKLGAVLDRSPKSLMRMFGPGGNPTAENLLYDRCLAGRNWRASRNSRGY